MADSNNTRRIPAAPYPPFISKQTGRGRGRYRQGVPGVQLTSPDSAANTPTTTTTAAVAAPSVPTQQQQQQQLQQQAASNHVKSRQHPARVEFFNSSIYGAINCLGHSSSNEMMGVTGGSGNKIRTSTNAGSSGKLNKVGPVLLELRCLHPRPENEEEEDEDILKKKDNEEKSSQNELYSWYQGNVIAITRGIASSSISSTCLSFRQSQLNSKTIPTSTHAEENNHQNYNETIHCATGLSNSALCIHTIKNLHDYVISSDDSSNSSNVLDSANSEDAKVAYLSHQTRQNRPVSAVSWRCNSSMMSGGSGNSSVQSNHVAIGYNSSHQQGERESRGSGGVGGQRSPPPQRLGHDPYSAGFFAYVWDVEAQSTASKGMKQVPLHKLAHNSSVSSLSWVPDCQLLALGCNQSQQGRNLHIHDLGMSGGPVLSTFAHDNAVHGIEFDPKKSHIFATFSRGLAEPVKLWDVRKMDSCVAEIKTDSTQSKLSNSSGRELPTFVSGIAWDPCAEGMLTIATGEDLKFYNTNLPRPLLTRISHTDGPVQCITYPLKCNFTSLENQTADYHPQRMIAVYNDGKVTDLPTQQIAPVAFSCRDGRVSSALGSNLCIGSTTDGPSAMEKITYDSSEDISSTMMRRARCLHVNRYSTDAKSNLQMLKLENDAFHDTNHVGNRNGTEGTYLTSFNHLHLLWSWIERVEKLCFRSNNLIDEGFWPAKTLLDSGVWRLLRLDAQDLNEITTFDSPSQSKVFNRDVFSSPFRRAALTACGWNEKEKLSHSESYERSAALACWHGDLGEAVATLQKGAAFIRENVENESKVGSISSNGLYTTQYAETLELVAMCVAGYSSAAKRDDVSSKVWRNACLNLLNRKDMSEGQQLGSKSQLNYLRAICSFLIDDSNLEKTLKDGSLNLSDRVAFACIYLPIPELKDYLKSCVQECLNTGNLEGLLITGLNRKGIALLQSYVDFCADIQTAALVSSRVILPVSWEKEKEVCSVWLSSYREFLNSNQMWQSRALFDVGRVELLRKLRERQQAEEQHVQPGGRVLRRTNNNARRQMLPTSSTARQNDNQIPSFPPQIHARCTYCNTPLPLSKLRKQENIANNWLSRQKSVLPCCPNPECRKPLPRCAICLLPLGCLNPYMELRREGNRIPRRGSHGQQRGEDLSNLASMPLGDWFAWCAKCNHGGHAQCLKSWFDSHSVCPVSNCDCRCQFDVIQKLKRPALTKEDD